MSEIIETRIGLLPSDWQIESLDEVTTKIQDGTHFSPQSNEGPCRYITSKNIRFGRMAVEDCGWISQKEHDAIYARCNVQRGDVLLTKDGANTGNAAINRLKEPFSLLSSVALIRADEHTADNGFLLQYLLSPRGQQRLKDLMAGNAITRLTLEKIKRFEVPQPVKSEQTKIARILTTLDNLIEKTEALIAKYQAIKQGMMHDLFTRGVDSSGQLRPTHEQAPDLYKPSEFGFGMIPTEWSEGTIADFCEIHNTLRFPISEEVRSSMQGDYRYYGPTGILDYINEYRVEGRFVLIGEDGDHFLKFEKQHMTILADGQFNVNNHAHILSGKPECLTEWIHLFFCHRDITFHVSRQGAGRLKLNKAALQAIPMLVPKEDEQERSYKRFKSAEKRIATETAQLRKLRKLKSGLMQDLLTGKVRVKVDEAEEVAANA